MIQISPYVILYFTYALGHSHNFWCHSHKLFVKQRADAHLFDTRKVFFCHNMGVITDDFSFERFIDKTFIWCIYKRFIFSV